VLRAVVLTQYRRLTDGRTDRRTDGQTDGVAVASTAPAMPALRRAVKIVTRGNELFFFFRMSLCGLRSYAILRRIAPSSAVYPSVFLSLYQCVTLVSPAKTAETIKLPFAFRTRVGSTNHVLHEVQMPTWEGAVLRGKRQTIVNNRDTPRLSVQKRLNRSRCRLGCGLTWAESITCYNGRSRSPMGRGNSGG